MRKHEETMRFLRRIGRGKSRKVILAVFDLVCFCVIDFFYYLLADQAAYSTPVDNGLIYFYNSLLIFGSIFGCRVACKGYHNVWRYTNTEAYFRLILADGMGAIIAIMLSRVLQWFIPGFYIGIWHSITVSALTALLALAARFAYRLLYKWYNKSDGKVNGEKAKVRVAIVGAGQLGAYLANELLNNPNSRYQPMCFIDINQTKIGNKVSGLPVYAKEDAKQVIENYALTDIIVAIAKIESNKMEALWKRYSGLGCKVKIYDSPIQTGEEDVGEKKRIVREFQIEDLLFRTPLTINQKEEFDYYKGKTVLVTGGGGSIGSELCRQIIKCNPKKLIIFDIYENNAYDIQQELIRKYGETIDLCVEIGSVRDAERLACVFENYRPDIVFHAAAHKHVPLMEHSGCEAVKNNVLGTYNAANMAERYGVEKFILISTDKAVNPTNIMGASKRLCEMIIQCRTDSATSFAAVRFGNVLGSNGSVIPLFRQQIISGGPITITDKRIIRYFMTIPEASQLVMQAGARAKNGELFVLDMGQPVRIYDLAISMIKLMGYEPEKDIEIKEVGLRPGEKLYEELLMKTETLEKTDNDMIFIEKDRAYTRVEVDEKIALLKEAVAASEHTLDSTTVKKTFQAVVPTFVDPETVNKNAEASEEMQTSKKQYSLT